MACRPRPLYSIHTTNLYFSGNHSFRDRNCFPETPIKTQSAQNSMLKSSPWLITGERDFEAVSRVTVTSHTGHCDLSVIQPQPNLSSSSKPWQNPFVQQTKSSTHWVLHSEDHPTHILHPTRGYASGSLQEGQVPITNKPFKPIPASLFLSLSILLLSYSIFNNLSVTPGHQSSACCYYAQPLQQQYQLENKTRYVKDD